MQIQTKNNIDANLCMYVLKSAFDTWWQTLARASFLDEHAGDQVAQDEDQEEEELCLITAGGLFSVSLIP